MQSVFTGPVYVVRDNIDTDQIIPAQYLNLIPTIEDEYVKLGSYAMCRPAGIAVSDAFRAATASWTANIPSSSAGGISAAAARANMRPSRWGRRIASSVLAESFARIFFRNCVATGEIYPCECQDRLCDILKNGDVVTVDLDASTVTVKETGKVYPFKPLGEVRPVVDAGGLFNYARKSGMMPA